jgi:hypothetical protein
MRIKFSAADEFLAELYEERGQVEDGILRLTYVQQQAKGAPYLHLSMYAGAVVRGKIVELRQYLGDLWRMSRDDEIKEHAEAIKAKIIEKARELNLAVRAGMFEP